MESKKINQLATNVNPQTSDLTTIGDPVTGQLKKITWLQVAHLIGAQASLTLQDVTNQGATTTLPITTGGLTLSNLDNGVLKVAGGVVSTYPYGQANGVASLDSGGKVPASQLPSSIMDYKGTWNAATNTPTLVNGTGDTGDVYRCNVAGTVNFGAGNITFKVGDWAIYNGTIWEQSNNSDAVSSVFGRTGDITAQEGDYNIGQLGDVTITSAATNDYLRYNGTGWVNTQFPTFVSSDKLVLQVRNNSGATINKGTVVYINGATAGYPTIAKAQADADNTSAQTLGLVQDNISNNSNGVVVIVGQITGIDTSAYPAGTQLYLSGTTAGAFTSTKTLAPTHLVYVGIVTTQNAVNGVIEVKIQNGYELDEIHDVAISSVANNQGLFYESSTSLWKNKSIATVLGYTPEQPLTFSAPLSRSTNTVSIPAATGSVNGYLSSTDWTTFNNKMDNPMTTLGDIIFGGTSGNPNRLAGNTTTTKQYLSQTGTGTDSASPVWATIAGSDITGAALTKTDDTNVTLTLGGTPATALLRAASLTLGWTGELAISRGGTGLAALGTAGQLLRVNTGATALEYFTPSYITGGFIGTTALQSTSANQALTGITGITFVAQSTDTASITSTIDGTQTFFDFNLSDDNNNDEWRWRFTPSGQSVYNAMRLVPVNNTSSNLIVSGTISASNFSGSSSGTNTGDQTDITGNAATATKLATARTLTIGATGKTFDGSANVSWTLAEIGAQPLLTNPVTGTGSANQIAYWNASGITGSATLTYTPTSSFLVNNSLTAASAIARGVNITSTLAAAANNDVLVGFDINPTFTNGSFTGLTNIGLRITVAQGNNIFLTKGTGPSIRFNKSNATAQIWEISAEDDFKIYDITNSSDIVLQINKTTGNISLKTITSGTWNGNVIGSSYGGAGSISGILKANGSGTVSAAVAGTDYVIPSALNSYLPLSGGTLTGTLTLTRSSGTGSGDYTNVTNPILKIAPTTNLWRIVHTSDSETQSGVYNYETGKSVYWGEDSDTGTYYFRGRSFNANISALGSAASLFLVSDSGTIKSRTAAQVRSDIGAQATLTNPVTGTGQTNRITYWDTPSSISYLDTASYPSLTELGYVKGVTSAIQTQLDGKQAAGSYVTINTTQTITGSKEFNSVESGGSGDFTNVTNPPIKISVASGTGHWRIPFLSNNDTISGVFNFQTGKNVYWGESTDTGVYYFRGRSMNVQALSGTSATFSVSSNGTSRNTIENTSSGTGAIGGITFNNNAGLIGVINVFGSAYTTSGVNIANSIAIGAGGNGLQLSAFGSSGKIRVYTGASETLALTISETQAATFSSALTVSSGYTTLNGLRISGADTGNTIYAGSNNMAITSESGYSISIGRSSDTTKAINVNTTNGHLGIRVSPSYPLHIDPATTNEVAIALNGTKVFAGANNYVRISAGDQYSIARAAIGFGYNGDTAWDIKYSSYANHSFWTGNDWGSSTEKVRINADGEMWIGYTSDQGSYKLQVNGSVYATAYYESSDIRLKNVLTNSYSENFSAIEFMWKDKRDDKRHWGYAAQDVMKYIPDAIEVNKDGMMTVNYNEAHTWKIAQLEAKIVKLEAKFK